MVDQKFAEITNSTNKEQWRKAVLSYFEQHTTAKEREEVIAVALTKIACFQGWLENMAFFAEVLSDIPLARSSMVFFIPNEKKLLTQYFLCLWNFPQKVLTLMEHRLLKELEAAVKGNDRNYQTLTSVAVTRLGTLSAAERIATYILTLPDSKAALSLFTLQAFLDMGEIAEVALFSEFNARSESDEIQDRMDSFAKEHAKWTLPPFSSNASIKALNELLSGEPTEALRAVRLVYLFGSKKGQLVESLSNLYKKVENNENQAVPEVVKNAFIHAKKDIVVAS